MPSPVAMLDRFSMSDLFMVLVNKVTAKNINAKNTTPMINRIGLEKPNCETSRKVTAAVAMEDRTIFADEPKSTVNP